MKKIWSPFRVKSGHVVDARPDTVDITSSYSERGVVFRPIPEYGGWLEDPGRFGAKGELVCFLAQLEEEGYADRDDGGLTISWANLYWIIESAEHRDGFELLGLPKLENWRFSLESRGTLTDNDFSIVLSGWIDPEGKSPSGNASVVGGHAADLWRVQTQASSLLPSQAALWYRRT